jgi:hypothetical protein
VITKGPEFAQWFCHGIQKSIHDHLRGQAVFRALDHPITESDVDLFLSGVQNIQGTDVKFVSGDYSAATDNLNVNVTAAIVEYICERIYSRSGRMQGLAFLIRQIITSLMTDDSLLLYEDGNPGNLPKSAEPLLIDAIKRSNRYSIRRNGQLMGCILSFPILCIANYASHLLYEARRVGRVDNPAFQHAAKNACHD